MNRILSLGAFVSLLAAAQPAAADDRSIPHVGERMVAYFDYCPNGWLPMEGQELPTSQYQILSAVLGSTYGGDGLTTFRLPAAKPLFEGAASTPATQCIAVTGTFPSRD